MRNFLPYKKNITMQITLPDNLVSVGKWQAFRGKYPSGSNVEHRIIIVFKQDGILKYLYVTSKIENAIKAAKKDPKSLVRLNSKDWEELTKDSCIQCGKSYMLNLNEEELRNDYKKGKVKWLGRIPEKVMKSIIFAICSSKTFDDKEKAMYTS